MRFTANSGPTLETESATPRLPRSRPGSWAPESAPLPHASASKCAARASWKLRRVSCPLHRLPHDRVLLHGAVIGGRAFGAATVRKRIEFLNPLARARGFHERAGRVNTFLSRPVRNGRRRPTGGASGSPLSFLLKGRFLFSPADSPCFHSHSRVELFAPVPVGVLNLKTGAAISVPN